MHARVRQRGVTLIELMITIAVAAVLLMIAVPSFRNITLANRLDTAANDVVNAIHMARMEAIKRNASVQFCGNSASAKPIDTLDGACVAGASAAVWATSGGVPSPVLAAATGLATPVRINGNLTALRFNGQGLARAAGSSVPYDGVVVDLCTSQMTGNNHRKITMAAGSILATAPSSGACP